MSRMRKERLVLWLVAGLFLLALGCDGGSSSNDPDTSDGDTDVAEEMPGEDGDETEQEEIAETDETVEIDETEPEPEPEPEPEESCTGCLIAGECYDDGTANPENPCRKCDVATAADDWTDDDGATCDDELWCTENDVCSGGVCGGTARECEDDLFCNGVETCDEDNDRCAQGSDPCDDGAFCNGTETCDEDNDRCVDGTDPCPDDGMFCNGEEGCDEDNDQCSAGTLPCPDDGDFCNGTESCNELDDACTHSGEPCTDDGAYCNGTESCDEDNDQCVSSGDPCTDDGTYCNGTESCDEDNDQCASSGDPCTDDGVFCNGDESCDEDNDQCVSSGDPCEINQHCDAADDMCISNCAVGQINYGDPLVDDDNDGVSEAAGDCNDASNTAYPGASEIFDGIDNDCDGIIDDGFDDDCDGYAAVAQGGDDCNDSDPYINPAGADNTQDTVDDNCDGVFGDLASGDLDNDGWAALGTDGVSVVDCDDNNAQTYPGTATNDDEHACMKDDDGDNWGDVNVESPVVAGTDCRDNDYWSWPGAAELPGDGIDQNCDGDDLTPSNVTGVFVSATLGDDNNAGTMEAPVASIAKGHEFAAARNVPVFVAAGAYHESVTLSVSLFGGYEAFNWTRDIDTYHSVINSQGRDAVLVDDSDVKIAIQGFTINGHTERTQQYTRGIFVSRNTGSSWVRIESNSINGGDAVFNAAAVDIAKGQALIAHNTIDGGTASTYIWGVFVGQYEWGRAWIEDNEISGGVARRETETQGYGVHVDGRTYRAWITGNTIHGSAAVRSAGVNIYGANATITRNVIDGGSLGESMGIFRIVTDTDIDSTIVTHNIISGGTGGNSYGMYVSFNAHMNCVANVIDGGSGTSNSYGAYVYEGGLTLINNTINGGSSAGASYGVAMRGDYYHYNWIIAVNNIIGGGNGQSSSNGIATSDRKLWLYNNLLYRNAGNGCDLHDGTSCLNSIIAINQCAWDNCQEAAANLQDVPGFISSTDYHITQDSECVDNGTDPSSHYDDAAIYLDIDDQSRPMGDAFDIGADEVIPPV